MKKSFLFPLLLSLSLIFISCGGGGGDGTSVNANQTFSSMEKEFVYDLFNTEYLWFDEVASNVDYLAFDTPQALMDGLKVSQDKWSFSLTEQEYEDMVNQKTEGFGFGYTNEFQIYLVRIDSPAWGHLQRGDIILKINVETATNENIAAASKNLNVATTFTVEHQGTNENIVITPREYTFKVTEGKILNGNIGYLRYDSFTDTSYSEYEAEFTKFKASGISDLIVDLRYNGGGSVEAASGLLDNFVRNHKGDRQVYLDWNVNYKSKNSTYSFDEDESNDLNMQRVIFLVTKNSASASELVISALKPYLGDTKVVTIGTATHGKPVGMSGRTYGSNYYFLINFEVKNNAGYRTSLDGIPATCTAEDDFTHPRGDEEETMLKTALDYIANGYSCP